MAVRGDGGDHRQGERQGEEEGGPRVLPTGRRRPAGRHPVRVPQLAAHESPPALHVRVFARVDAQRAGRRQAARARAQTQGEGLGPEVVLEARRGARGERAGRRGALRLRASRRRRRPRHDRRSTDKGGGDHEFRRRGQGVRTPQRAPSKALARVERRGEDAGATRGGAREGRVGLRAKERGEAAIHRGRRRLSRRVRS